MGWICRDSYYVVLRIDTQKSTWDEPSRPYSGFRQDVLIQLEAYTGCRP